MGTVEEMRMIIIYYIDCHSLISKSSKFYVLNCDLSLNGKLVNQNFAMKTN